MVETEIIGAETIRPSRATPDRHKKFGLSVFDQYIPGDHTPLVLLYHDDGGQTTVPDRIRRLKLSLSEALVVYYPVAGRVDKDAFHVDCNDAGVDFVEAKVKGCCLTDILVRPDDKVVSRLLPVGPLESGGHPLLRVQVNVFECGGMAIGFRFGHILMDACAIHAFLTAWAALARGDTTEVSAPDLNVIASLFPAIPRTTPPLKARKVHKCSTRRFVFGAAEIAALREKVSSPGGERPTRVLAVVALLWNCLSKNKTRPSIASQPMNIRGRLEPPLSANSIGNMTLPSFAEYDDGDELHELADKLRLGVRHVVRNYVPKLVDSESARTVDVELVEKFVTLVHGEDINFYIFTSWCRYGWYELDFGWGRPAWITSVNPDLKNVVVMTDTRDGDGIEVSATLPEQDMIFFETDPELLEFASFNPSACP